MIDFRPENLLDFLVWCQREKTANRMTLQEIRVIGIRAVQYIDSIDDSSKQTKISDK